MNAIGASVVAVLVFVVFFAPRRWALLGMMASVLYLTKGEVVDVVGFNIYPVRLLEVVGFIRVVVRREFSYSRINGMDKALLLAYAYTMLVFVLRSSLDQGPATDITQVSTADKIGVFVDAMFCYVIFRALIESIGEFVWFLRGFVILLCPYVLLVSAERITGHNPFAAVGGLPDIWISGGRIRCSGSFTHPSLLGTFGASFLPLYIGLALTKNNRLPAFIGIGLCLGIVFLSNSGGPLIVVAVGVLAWLLWTVRTRMLTVRLVIAGAFVSLALFMKAPLWYLPDKLSSIFGGDGWHRSYLMDAAFMDVDRWWFAGMSLDQTRGWFPYRVMGAADITNLYLTFGLDAGLLAMGFFIYFLVRAFQTLGRALAVARSNSPTPTEVEILLWGLGAVLAGHIANFFAITYFDQIYVVWFMQLAAISTISQASTLPKVAIARHRPRVELAQKQSI